MSIGPLNPFGLFPEPQDDGPVQIQVSSIFALDPPYEEPSRASLAIVQDSARNAVTTRLLAQSRVRDGEEHWNVQYYHLPEPGGLPANAVLRDGRPVVACKPEEATIIQVTLVQDSVLLGRPGSRGGADDGKDG